ncbi:chorismate-binding protein [Escherichia coli]
MGAIVDHQRHTVSLLSHNDVDARGLAGKPAILAAGRFHAHFRLAIQYDREQYGEKFASTEYLHSGDCYQVNLAQRFHATYSGDEWQAFLQLDQANAPPFSAFLRLEQGAI